MSTTERQDTILNLLEQHRFLTVKRLSELTYTSPSSIRRDLSHLENLYFIKRSHGGASIADGMNHPANLMNRMKMNTLEKRRIAKKASRFLADGQSIFLDSSTTASFLVPYIAHFSDITLFTNNMITAVNAANLSVNVHCLGGKCLNNSAVLSGEETYDAIERVNADIVFFSSHCIDTDGTISDPTAEENHARKLMLKNSKRTVFLCTSEKFSRRSTYNLTSANDIYACVFDTEWNKFKGQCKVL